MCRPPRFRCIMMHHFSLLSLSLSLSSSLCIFVKWRFAVLCRNNDGSGSVLVWDSCVAPRKCTYVFTLLHSWGNFIIEELTESWLHFAQFWCTWINRTRNLNNAKTNYHFACLIKVFEEWGSTQAHKGGGFHDLLSLRWPPWLTRVTYNKACVKLVFPLIPKRMFLVQNHSDLFEASQVSSLGFSEPELYINETSFCWVTLANDHLSHPWPHAQTTCWIPRPRCSDLRWGPRKPWKGRTNPRQDFQLIQCQHVEQVGH